MTIKKSFNTKYFLERLKGEKGDPGVVTTLPFKIVAYLETLTLDAVTNKDFKCGLVTGNMTLEITNAVDGDAGMIILIIDSTGGYTITLGSSFSVKLGVTNIDASANKKNIISWRKDADDVYYTIIQAV